MLPDEAVMEGAGKKNPNDENAIKNNDTILVMKDELFRGGLEEGMFLLN